jgi:hypothetical protein
MVIGAETTYFSKGTNFVSTQRETNVGQVSEKAMSTIGTDLNSSGKISKSDNSTQFNRNGYFIGPLKLKKSLEVLDFI